MASDFATRDSKMQQKQKKPFFFLFISLFVPTSLFFFLLICNTRLPGCSSINEKEGEKSNLDQPIITPLPFIHLQYPKPNLSPRRRTHHNKSKIKYFRQWRHPNTTHFSTRASNFFSSSSTCNPRFFMTWISSSLDKFGTRELFSVQSLFRSHPEACLLILSTSLDSAGGEKILRPFVESGFHVAAFSPDFSFLLRRTPASQWLSRLRRGEVETGQISIGQNLSNLLRLALLYKYGGVYIDTDVIVLRSLSGLRNAIGAQAVDSGSGNWTRLNNAVMVFDRDHPLLVEFIREFAMTFDGSKWGHNGPYLVSRVVSRVPPAAFGFTVLPPAAFYPVDWSRIEGLFVGPRDGRHERWVSAKLRSIRENSFAVHLWNRQSRRLKVERGSIIGRIMSGCCLFCNSSSSAV